MTYEEIVEINERQKCNYLYRMNSTKQRSNYKDLYTCRLYYDKENKKLIVKNNGDNNWNVQLVKMSFSDIKDIYSFYELGPYFYIKNISELKKYSYVYNSYNISFYDWQTLVNILRRETFIEGIYFKKVDNLGRLLGKIVLSGGEILLKHNVGDSNILKQNTVIIALIKKNDNLYVYSDCTIVLKSKYFESSSKVTNLLSRLNCNKLYIDNLDISDLKTLRLCFSNNTDLEEIELRNFDTSNIESMEGMFYRCVNLKKVNLESLSTKNVTIFSAMFKDCDSIQNLDLSSFKIDNLVHMDNMFQNCYKLETIDISTWNTNKKIYLKDFLDKCTKLKEVKGIENLLKNGLNKDTLGGYCPYLYEVLKIDFL